METRLRRFFPRTSVPSACLAVLLALLAGCGRGDSPEEPSGKLQVYVVNYPLEYFAKRIGRDLVDVHFPAPTDVDPAFWRPSEDVIEAYQKADLILLNGASYAKWVDKASLPPRKLVSTTDAFRELWIATEETVVHQHGPDGEHVHQGTAFTTWLDFRLAAEQAEAIYEALAERLPEHRDELKEALTALEDDLLDLDAGLKQIVDQAQTQPLLASHPVYQYLARRLDLNLVSLHWEPHGTPSEEEWQKLEELQMEHQARWMLWEAEPLEEVRERLERMEITPVVFPPCGNRPASGNFLDAMRVNVERLKPIFDHS